MLLAHRKIEEDGTLQEQSLEEHLMAVGSRCAEIGKSVGLENLMRLLGLLHDAGKADGNFQKMVRGEMKHRVNHSSAGGKILEDWIFADPKFNTLKEKLSFRYFREISTYVIFAHHGLYDQVSYGSSDHNRKNRLQYDKDGDYHYREDVLPFIQELEKKTDLLKLAEKAYEEFRQLFKVVRKLSKNNVDKSGYNQEKEYYMACLARLCLSILKEADIYDSANAFFAHKQFLWNKLDTEQVWKEASSHIEEEYQKYRKVLEHNKTSKEDNGKIYDKYEINRVRNYLAEIAKKAAVERDTGIFKLELPTGGGKTRAGLRYALTNASQYGRSRIFYITAYLSVLEQNAADIREIIHRDEVVLEHHSNMVEEENMDGGDLEDSSDYESRTYLKESWENPIILTTMVQFSNTLYKEKASNIRRFCKLINSVIIIDEVQSIPLKTISNFNLMMNFMKTIMHCNIVHCTATQPALDSKVLKYRTYYGDAEGKGETISGEIKKQIACFDRVDFYNLTGCNALETISSQELSRRIYKQLEIVDSCLVVLNTKAAVGELYDYLEQYSKENIEFIYLTTYMCPAHRLDVIREIKEKLKRNRKESKHYKIICISTKLIEAGVDVDFDIVFRSIAGIDSLIQCAGRCNREGKMTQDGDQCMENFLSFDFRVKICLIYRKLRLPLKLQNLLFAFIIHVNWCRWIRVSP